MLSIRNFPNLKFGKIRVRCDTFSVKSGMRLCAKIKILGKMDRVQYCFPLERIRGLVVKLRDVQNYGVDRTERQQMKTRLEGHRRNTKLHRNM